jgi:hypothetical protein
MSCKTFDKSNTLPLSAAASLAARESKDQFCLSLDPLAMPSPALFNEEDEPAFLDKVSHGSLYQNVLGDNRFCWSLDPLAAPSPALFNAEDALAFLDKVSHVLGDNSIGFDIDPTPIAARNIQVVQEVHISDDSTWKRYTMAATDVLTLPSQKKHSRDDVVLLHQEGNNDIIRPFVEQQRKKPRVEGEQRATSFKTKRRTQQTEEQPSHFQRSQLERFTEHQAKRWYDHFNAMIQFRSAYGHCCVPNTFPANPGLLQWIRRQRYQYKLKQESRRSTLTDEREAALEQLGFVWNTHGAAWLERWNELAEYRRMSGHSNVPANSSEKRQLAIWVKCQRRQYRVYKRGGRTNSMTPERIVRLESLDFAWNPRGL